MMMKQSRQRQKQVEPKCCKYSKTATTHHSLEKKSEPTCHRYDKNDRRASKCCSKVDMLPTCTYYHRLYTTLKNAWLRGAVEKQKLWFAKSSELMDAKVATKSGESNILFVRRDYPVEEDNMVAAYKRNANGELLIENSQQTEGNVEGHSRI